MPAIRAEIDWCKTERGGIRTPDGLIAHTGFRDRCARLRTPCGRGCHSGATRPTSPVKRRYRAYIENPGTSRRFVAFYDRRCTRVTPSNLHGKEGVDGSRTSEGLTGLAGVFCIGGSFRLGFGGHLGATSSARRADLSLRGDTLAVPVGDYPRVVLFDHVHAGAHLTPDCVSGMPSETRRVT